MLRNWLLLGTVLSTQALAQADLSAIGNNLRGQRSQVLVLGSVHLSQLPKGLQRDTLAPLMDKLAAFKPDIIAIEAISGEGCDLAARHPAIYGESIAPYCRDTSAAREATGLDVPAAIAEMNRLLKAWPAQPTPAQRKRLAAVFLAANERASALAQWLQLPDSERKPSPELADSLAAMLGKLAATQNEDFMIAAPLAARLGLARLHAMDDHSGDNVDVADEKAYGTAIEQAWSAAADQAQPVRKREAELSAAKDLLPLYRYINRPDVQQVASAVDFGAALRDVSPQQYGRLYVAGWEVRNMRMAANIHASFRERPGARVLTIVGATHKPWLERLLALGQGVEIVDAQGVLK